MSITETAARNHEKWFPGRTSTLKASDPEFIEYFDSFAFDDVLSHADLDDRTRMMTILAALIAAQALSEFRVIAGAALTLGVTPVEIKEIVYQAVPYCGIGKVFDFLHAANEVLAGRGVRLPLDRQSTTTPETRFDQGLALSRSIFGAAIDTTYRQAPADQQHINRFLSANCFGDTYTRTGLDVKTRELLTFAMLLALGGCEPQLKGHIRGNLEVGNGRDTLMAVVTQLLPFVGYPRTLNAMACLNEVAPHPGRPGPQPGPEPPLRQG
jgi:4-carboxymuconolactone decarboxylase